MSYTLDTAIMDVTKNMKEIQSNPKTCTKFQADDLVLCRFNGYPYWPAIIVSSAKSKKYLCNFFNDKSAAFVEQHKIIKYHPDYGAMVSLSETDPLKPNLVAAVSAANKLWTKNGCPEKADLCEDFKLCHKGNFLHPEESRFDQLGVDEEKEELCKETKEQDEKTNVEIVSTKSSDETTDLENFDTDFKTLQAAVDGVLKYKSYVESLESSLENEIKRRKDVEKELLKEKKTAHDLRKIIKSIRKVVG